MHNRFVKAAVTTRMRSIVGLVSDGLLTNVIGKVPWRILYFFRSCQSHAQHESSLMLVDVTFLLLARATAFFL